MKYVQICKYDEPIEETDPYSREVVLQQHIFNEDSEAIAHIFPESSLVFVESVGEEISFSDIPFAVSRFISNRGTLYRIYRQLGKTNIEEFSVVPPSGMIYDVLEEEPEKLDTLLQNASYPVSKAVYNINGSQLVIEGSKLTCDDSLNLEPIYRAYDSVISSDE